MLTGGLGRGEGHTLSCLFFYLMRIHSISHAVPLFGTMMHGMVGMDGRHVDPQVDAHLLLWHITS